MSEISQRKYPVCIDWSADFKARLTSSSHLVTAHDFLSFKNISELSIVVTVLRLSFMLSYIIHYSVFVS